MGSRAIGMDIGSTAHSAPLDAGGLSRMKPTMADLPSARESVASHADSKHAPQEIASLPGQDRVWTVEQMPQAGRMVLSLQAPR